MGHFYNPPPPFMGATQPHGGRELSPSLEAVPEDNPPFKNAGRLAITGAIIALCQPAPAWAFMGGRQMLAPRTLPPSITAQSVSDPPFGHEGRWEPTHAIIRAWQPPDPSPFMGRRQGLEPRKLPPSISAVPENDPPFGHEGSFVGTHPIIWSWHVPGPAPTQRPRYVPLTAVSVADDPPFGDPDRRVALQVVQSWLLATTSSPVVARLPSPGIPGWSVDNPPPVKPKPDLRSAWEVAVAPIVLREPSPGLPGWSVDNPPPAKPEQDLRSAWEVPVTPIEARLMSPGIPGMSVDNPPAIASTQSLQLSAWPAKPVLVQLTLPAVPQEETAAVDSPPIVGGRQDILRGWFQPGPQPTQGRKLPPSVMAVAVNDPPFNQRNSLSGILLAWQPAAPTPWVVRYAIQGVAVNDPPFTQRRPLPGILAAWQPVPSVPWSSRYLVQELVVTVTYTPLNRAWMGSVLSSWVDAPAPAQRARQLSPGIPGQSVDAPPFTQRTALPGILAAWQPASPLPWVARYIAPSLEVVFTPLNRVWLGPVLSAWRAVDPPATRPRTLPPSITAVAVNDPPFGSRNPLPNILAAWQPGPPAEFRPVRRGDGQLVWSASVTIGVYAGTVTVGAYGGTVSIHEV